MAGSGDHLNATASQPAGSGLTREEFANLQQQLYQLCARLEKAGIFWCSKFHHSRPHKAEFSNLLVEECEKLAYYGGVLANCRGLF